MLQEIISVEDAKILASLSQVVLALLGLTISFMAYRWHHKKAKNDAARNLAEDYRHYNTLVINNEELQDRIIEQHWRGKLDRAQVVKMYQYFILLNGARSLFEANKNGSVSKKIYASSMACFAKSTFKDREFIREHVFERGYDDQFTSTFDKMWKDHKNRKL